MPGGRTQCGSKNVDVDFDWSSSLARVMAGEGPASPIRYSPVRQSPMRRMTGLSVATATMSLNDDVDDDS